MLYILTALLNRKYIFRNISYRNRQSRSTGKLQDSISPWVISSSLTGEQDTLSPIPAALVTA
jgi:hypothetical protein